MVVTSKNVLFPGPNHCLGDYQSVESSALMVGRCLGLGNWTFLEVASMVVTWWTVAFLLSVMAVVNDECCRNVKWV